MILLTQSWILLFRVVNSYVKVKGLSEENQLDLHNRIMGTFHGLISSGVSLYLLNWSFLKNGPESLFLNLIKIQQTRFIIMFSLTYFVYHAYICYQCHIKGIGMHFHHTLAIGCLFFSLYHGENYYYPLMGLFIGESSGALTQFRPLLTYIGYRYTKFFIITERCCVCKVIANFRLLYIDSNRSLHHDLYYSMYFQP